jgi:ketosteroid isomerase-like protein
MDHPHIETIRRFFQAYAQRDLDGLRGIPAADGRKLDHFVCVLWRFEDSRIVEGRHFFSDPEAVDGFFNHVAGAP